MHRKVISTIFYVIMSLILFGCGPNKKRHSCLLLPNGSLLKCTLLSDLDSLHKLTYEQYQGFTGTMDDKILKKFTVLIEGQSKKIGRDIASDEHIKSLKNEYVLGLKFDKVPESIMSYEEIVQYVSGYYPILKKRKTETKLDLGINEEIEFINEKNDVVVKVQYSKLGISGTFVILKCTSC